MIPEMGQAGAQIITQSRKVLPGRRNTRNNVVFYASEHTILPLTPEIALRQACALIGSGGRRFLRVSPTASQPIGPQFFHPLRS